LTRCQKKGKSCQPGQVAGVKMATKWA